MKTLILIQKPNLNSIQLTKIGSLIKNKDIILEFWMGVYLSNQLPYYLSIYQKDFIIFASYYYLPEERLLTEIEANCKHYHIKLIKLK